MRLHRFYTTEELAVGEETRVNDPALLHQWIKVFRMSAGDSMILFNGDGYEYDGTFSTLAKKEAVITLSSKQHTPRERDHRVHVFLSLIKKDNTELVAQKITELGAAAFHPIITERSEKKSMNMERVEKIVIEAAEQSGRGSIPGVHKPKELEEALRDFEGTLYVFDFDAPRFVPPKEGLIGIVIGPEGGWTFAEQTFFNTHKIQRVSLGELTLRAETAAIVAVGISTLS